MFKCFKKPVLPKARNLKEIRTDVDIHEIYFTITLKNKDQIEAMGKEYIYEDTFCCRLLKYNEDKDISEEYEHLYTKRVTLRILHTKEQIISSTLNFEPSYNSTRSEVYHFAPEHPRFKMLNGNEVAINKSEILTIEVKEIKKVGTDYTVRYELED